MTERLKEFRRILIHPEDGFYAMHILKSGSVIISLIISLLWFFSELFTQQYTSFRYNNYNKTDINIIYIFLGTFLLSVLFSVANWAICTLFDGEGSFREIVIVTGYSLFPFVVTKFINVVLSYTLSLDESVFVSILSVIGLLYTAVLLFVGLIQIHDYTFGRMLISVIATVVGIFLILALGFLTITLFQQLFSFIGSVFEEITMRSLK